ncbi:hypothetical protein CN936_25740 [Bacillus cereus]|uniref:hypothetical protein n=1 Tax=Bacillus cereus group TaxID=86661 RepID=UPI000BF157C4|nr:MULTISPECIES: hypothetical protein [Bacillus cereus group]PEL63246.1 hypothetical protein CN622_10790 [Bacillus wiedmannii]PEU21530.1 hypothetical protein CN526_26820 [Bacillus wiedmannii]PFR72900.1 hypothetical protein COK29_22295 [Bacillus cereus]PGL90845.1 hypothetical protein CN936_25740 [Bacillus cereus]
MDRKELAKDLTVAYLQNKPGLVKSVDDAVLVYEKFFEAVNRSASVGTYDHINPEELVRN